MYLRGSVMHLVMYTMPVKLAVVGTIALTILIVLVEARHYFYRLRARRLKELHRR